MSKHCGRSLGRLSVAIGVTSLALIGGAITAVPTWAVGALDLSVADLTAAASGSGGAFTVSGPTATDDVTINGDVDVRGTAAAGRMVRITSGTALAPRLITLKTVVAASSDSVAAIQLAADANVRFTLTGTSELAGSATNPGLGIPVGTSVVITSDTLAGRLNPAFDKVKRLMGITAGTRGKGGM